MPRPAKQPPSTIDLTAHFEDGRVSVADLLKHGTPAEMREYIGLVAAMLESKSEHLDRWRPWLIAALRQIALGGDANKAFGLKRKGPSPREVKGNMALANSLMRQGMSKADAFDFIARYDSHRGIIRPTNPKGGDAGAALMKKTVRAHKRILGRVSRTK